VYVFTFVTSPASTSGRRRWAVPALALAAALAAGACGPGGGGGASGGHGGNGHDEVPVSVFPSKPSKPMSVQQIAKELGCEVKLAGKFADYRQTPCEFGGKKFILVDFDTDEGAREWLEGSKSYGGYYLVGTRWVVSGNYLRDLSPLQDTLGGKIEKGDIHGPPPSSPQAGN
jgi:hypothetical protein